MWSALRFALALLVWLLDLLLKAALGQGIVILVWWCCHGIFGVSFGMGWLIAGGFVGCCLMGFFEGCNIILLDLVKRIEGEP
jgi:hypothetical protein